MKYQVFQDGKPADCNGFPEMTSLGYGNSVFDDFDKAVEYAHIWAFPYQMPKCCHKRMELNVPVDLGQNEIEVMMEIRPIAGE